MVTWAFDLKVRRKLFVPSRFKKLLARGHQQYFNWKRAVNLRVKGVCDSL